MFVAGVAKEINMLERVREMRGQASGEGIDAYPGDICNEKGIWAEDGADTVLQNVAKGGDIGPGSERTVAGSFLLCGSDHENFSFGQLEVYTEPFSFVW